MRKTFVGIGFGAIQCGLFLLEAQGSKNFERLAIAEIVPETVVDVSKNAGNIRVNVAHQFGIRTHDISGIEIYNPLDDADAAKLVDVIAHADEIATALPSVDFYQRGRPSPAELLALGIERKLSDVRLPRAVVYTAENCKHAAERLREAVLAAFRSVDQVRLNERVQFLNTVIGKMSGIVTDPAQMERDDLAPFVVGGRHAVLVEEYNRILVSQVLLADFQRGIPVFQEKPDLLPFEEAKLYGHNAAHAVLGYLAHRAGLTFMHEASPSLCRLVTDAFRKESGDAICRRHAGVDQLFTQCGWAEYADDLMRRMVNPFLQDRVDRVIRDPLRKLGWDDRLIGTMRLAIKHGIEPRCIAFATAVAAELLLPKESRDSARSLLAALWKNAGASAKERDVILQRIEQATPYHD